MNQVLEFWRARNSRERWIIIAAAALITIFLIDAMLLQPLLKSRARLRLSVPELRIAAADVKAQSQLAGQLKARAGARAAQAIDLPQAIAQAASAAGLSDKLSEVRSTDSNRANVTIDSAAFDAVVNWLSMLQLQFGTRIESGQIEALPESGMVKLRAVLANAK